MKQIESLPVISAVTAINQNSSPLSKILKMFSSKSKESLEVEKKMLNFNKLLKEYQELERKIEAPLTQKERNRLFYENETRWNILFDELNLLRTELGSRKFSLGSGYEIS